MGKTSKDYHYATTRPLLFDEQSRFEKAEKIFLILNEKWPYKLEDAVVLDIGCSSGLIDCWLADRVQYIYGLDIDKDILSSVKKIEQKTTNFTFIYGGGHQLPFKGNQFEIIVANGMYYLLSHKVQQDMLKEIYRCLKPNGVCYFAGPNRMVLIDGKYKLPFLIWMPVWFGRKYVRLFSPIKEYNEYYKTIFGLRKMIKKHFVVCEDITLEVLDHPDKYKLLKVKNKFIRFSLRVLARIFYVFLPSYIFILKKTKSNRVTDYIFEPQ
jgi:ubiquinone/menaquinone biosynthesis C-methylase UbiE